MKEVVCGVETESIAYVVATQNTKRVNGMDREEDACQCFDGVELQSKE